MHKIEELREMLVAELEQYGARGELTAGTLDVIDKLAHALKNIDKVLENEMGGGYSATGYYADDMSRGGSYARGMSRNRDSMGRYSRDGYSRGSFADEMRELMRNAPDDRTRQDMERMISRMG